MLVDKTDVIAQLADVGDFLIFLRPAGFGKSLLVSTLAAMWRGGPTPSGAFARKAVGAMNRAGSW